jgi:hypothetical protein
MSPEITAEDYRTAVKVMRYGVDGCGSSSHAGRWTKEADRLDALAAEDAYVLELAKHMAATAHPNMRWEQWTSGTPGGFQEAFVTEARAVLAKLEADGRLRPPVVDAEIDEPAEEWATWQEVPDGVQYRSLDGHGPWFNWEGRRLYALDGEPSRWTDTAMAALAPFARAEA